VTPATVRAFNTIWYRRAPARHIGLRDLAGYFHRLDSADGWNRAAGPAALRRYQFVVPDQAERLLEDILDAVRRHGCPPFLGRLQRLGAASGGEAACSVWARPAAASCRSRGLAGAWRLTCPQAGRRSPACFARSTSGSPRPAAGFALPRMPGSAGMRSRQCTAR